MSKRTLVAPLLGLSVAAALVSCAGLLPGTDVGDGGADASETSLPDVAETSSPDAPCESGCGENAVVQVGAAVGSGCALTKGGALWCWGLDQDGELGVAPTSAPETYPFVLDLGGSVYCNHSPAPVPGLHDVVQFSGGNETYCAVEMDHTVWCWGNATDGFLGHPSAVDITCPDGRPCNPVPTQVPDLLATSVSLENANPCALTVTDEVACWGDNSHGELANGELGGSSSTPVTIPNFHDVTKVASYGPSACALKKDGSVWCWGWQYATAGLGHISGNYGDVPCTLSTSETLEGFCSLSPIPVYLSDDATPAFGPPSLAGTQPATDITVGNSSACAVVDYQLWCWGNDAEGLVGPANLGRHFFPSHYVDGNYQLTAVSTSVASGCDLHSDGTVSCWGQDEWGELGIGFPESDAAVGGCSDEVGCFTPTLLSTLRNVVSVSAAFAQAIALKGDGTVWAWGLNDTARLGHVPGTDGDQSFTPRPNATPIQTAFCNPTPTQVMGLP